MKFKFLFKSLYSHFEKETAFKLTAFPSGNAVNEITLVISIFSIWPPLSEAVGPILDFLGFSFSLNFLWVLVSMIHVDVTCVSYLF